MEISNRQSKLKTTFRITGFRINNFKSIYDSGIINFTPIMVLLGENNVGKSALLQSLLLLKQSIENNKDGDYQLLFNGEYVKLHNFENVVYKHDIKKTLGYTFYFNNNSYLSLNYSFDIQNNKIFCSSIKIQPYYEDVEELVNKIKIINIPYKDRAEIEFYSKKQMQVFKKSIAISKRNNLRGIIYNIFSPSLRFSYINLPNNKEKIHNILKGWNQKQIYNSDPNLKGKLLKGYQRAFLQKRFQRTLDYYLKSSETKGKSELIQFDPVELSKFFQSVNYALLRGINEQFQLIERFLKNIRWLGPHRNSPKRFYEISEQQTDSVGSRGQYINRILGNENDLFNLEPWKEINNFLGTLNPKVKIDHDISHNTNLFQILLKEENFSYNIVDAGFGYSQLLPIIIQTLIQSKKSNSKVILHSDGHNINYNANLSMIEQPEIHLNPKLQVKLADFIINSTIQNKKNISGIVTIIETHSEYFVTRFHRRVLEKNGFNKNDLSIFFVTKKKQMSEFRQIRISDNGQYDHWPDNFLDEDYIDTIEILKNGAKIRK